MNRTTAWLRVILWIAPGVTALLLILMADNVIGGAGLSLGNAQGLLLLAFTCVLALASYCDALLSRKQKNDPATSLILQGLFFGFCQIFITPLVAGVLGFASCMFQLG